MQKSYLSEIFFTCTHWSMINSTHAHQNINILAILLSIKTTESFIINQINYVLLHNFSIIHSNFPSYQVVHIRSLSCKTISHFCLFICILITIEVINIVLKSKSYLLQSSTFYKICDDNANCTNRFLCKPRQCALCMGALPTKSQMDQYSLNINRVHLYFLFEWLS